MTSEVLRLLAVCGMRTSIGQLSWPMSGALRKCKDVAVGVRTLLERYGAGGLEARLRAEAQRGPILEGGESGEKQFHGTPLFRNARHGSAATCPCLRVRNACRLVCAERMPPSGGCAQYGRVWQCALQEVIIPRKSQTGKCLAEAAARGFRRLGANLRADSDRSLQRAWVGRSVQIGPSVRIGSRAQIGPSVRIGLIGRSVLPALCDLDARAGGVH